MTVLLFGANKTCEKLMSKISEPFYITDTYKTGDISGVEIHSPIEVDLILSSSKVIICSQGGFDEIAVFLKMIGVLDEVIYSADSDGNLVSYESLLEFRKKGILMVTMPKSGTAWLFNAIKNAARYKKVYTVARLVNKQNCFEAKDIDAPDLQKVCRNGEILGGHLFCTNHSLKVLRNHVVCGELKLIVNWRDPRQALISWTHHIDRIKEKFDYDYEYLGYPDEYGTYSLEQKISHNIEGVFHSYIEWLKSWKNVFESDYGQHCLFVSQEMLSKSPLEYRSQVCDFLGVDHIGLDSTPKKNENHFRVGSTDEWLNVCTSSQIERMNNLLIKNNILDFIYERICNN